MIFKTLSSFIKRYIVLNQNNYRYKRSSRLVPKDEKRPKRTYGPIVKPVLNDEFDKQVKITKFLNFRKKEFLDG